MEVVGTRYTERLRLYIKTGVKVDTRRRKKEKGKTKGNMEEDYRLRKKLRAAGKLGGRWNLPQRTERNGFYWLRRYVPHRLYSDNDDDMYSMLLSRECLQILIWYQGWKPRTWQNSPPYL